MRKRWKFPNKENLFFQSKMDESKPFEEIRTWEHPPWYGIDQFKEKVLLIFLVSSTTSRLISGCRWSDKWFLVHFRKLHIPPSRWTQSQILLAERWIIPYSTEVHWRFQSYTHELGCQEREAHWWLMEYRWVSRFVWSLDRFHTIYYIARKTYWRIFVVRVEVNKKTAYIQARSSMARALEVNGKARQVEGEAKLV